MSLEEKIQPKDHQMQRALALKAKSVLCISLLDLTKSLDACKMKIIILKKFIILSLADSVQ